MSPISHNEVISLGGGSILSSVSFYSVLSGAPLSKFRVRLQRRIFFSGTSSREHAHSGSPYDGETCAIFQQSKDSYPDDDVDNVDRQLYVNSEGDSNDDAKADTVEKNLYVVVDHASTTFHDP